MDEMLALQAQGSKADPLEPKKLDVYVCTYMYAHTCMHRDTSIGWWSTETAGPLGLRTSQSSQHAPCSERTCLKNQSGKVTEEDT